MTSKKKRPPRWRVAFLRALRGTRNVRRAAWAVGVDYTTAYNHRKRDAGFAAEWAEALAAESRVGVGGSGGEADFRPSELLAGGEKPLHRLRRSPSPAKAGEEYIVRSSARSGPQLVRAGEGRWSAKAERAFLGELADHGNVRRAAAACGFSTTALYTRRLNYPDFAAKWAAAKECGRERIDLYLIEIANRTLDPDAFEVPDHLPKVTVAEAIQILKLHQASDKGQLGTGRKKPRSAASIEAMREEVLRRVAAIRRHRGWDQDEA